MSKTRMLKIKIESYQSQYEAAESMLNDIYRAEIIGETAYNVINQALQSMGKIIAEREGLEYKAMACIQDVKLKCACDEKECRKCEAKKAFRCLPAKVIIESGGEKNNESVH